MTLRVLRLPLLFWADFVPENGPKPRRFLSHSTNRFVSSHEPICLTPRARLSHPTNRLAPAHEPVCLVPRTDLSHSTSRCAPFHEPAGLISRTGRRLRRRRFTPWGAPGPGSSRRLPAPRGRLASSHESMRRRAAGEAPPAPPPLVSFHEPIWSAVARRENETALALPVPPLVSFHEPTGVVFGRARAGR